MSRRTAAAVAVLAAAGILLTGCRGPAAGAGSGPATGSAPTPASVAASATPAADGSEPVRLAGVETALDRIERELDSDVAR